MRQDEHCGFINPNEEGVSKRSVLQGVKEDYDDERPSSKMRCTHVEACEEDVKTARNILHQDNKCGILSKVFQQFRDVLMDAVLMWYDTE